MKRERGIYVTLSGGENAGKTGHIDGLRNFLVNKGLECIATNEPGGTRIGSDIRRILLNVDYVNISPKTELLLYVADRAQQFDELNRPTLDSGTSIISDRCFLETLVYQGYARGFDKEVISYLNNFAMGDVRPDVSFIIDGDPEEMRKNSDRGLKDYDRLDLETVDFHKKVREGFLDIAKNMKDSCTVIPYVSGGQENMQHQMREVLINRFGL